MSSLILDRLVEEARKVDKEHRDRIEQTKASILKRWQQFRNQYETVAVSLVELCGVSLTRHTDTLDDGTRVTYGRQILVRGVETLPAQPLETERTFLIEMYTVSEGRPRILITAWSAYWRRYEHADPKRTYNADDKMWRGLHNDSTYTTSQVLDEVVRLFRYNVDLDAYSTTATGARQIDL